MKMDDRLTNRSLIEKFFRGACRFEFFQAVRLIQNHYPDKTPVGEGPEPDKEAVRFKSEIGLEFPPNEILEARQTDTEGVPVEMLVNFMGIAGCLGPMPLPYTELIMDRVRHGDTAFRDFLNIFNHRLISLLYRAKKIHRIGFESGQPEQDRFATYLFSIMGLGTKGLRDRMTSEGLKDRALLKYAAIIAQQPHSMSGLECILSDYFNVAVKGKQLCGKWLEIDEDEITKVGVMGIGHELGRNALVGNRFWDQQGKFELHVGPLSYAEFYDLLPVGTAFVPFCRLTEFYTGMETDFDIILELKADEIPTLRLSKSEKDKGARLSWTSWLVNEPDRYNGENTKIRLSSTQKTAPILKPS